MLSGSFKLSRSISTNEVTTQVSSIKSKVAWCEKPSICPIPVSEDCNGCNNKFSFTTSLPFLKIWVKAVERCKAKYFTV